MRRYGRALLAELSLSRVHSSGVWRLHLEHQIRREPTEYISWLRRFELRASSRRVRVKPHLLDSSLEHLRIDGDDRSSWQHRRPFVLLFNPLCPLKNVVSVHIVLQLCRVVRQLEFVTYPGNLLINSMPKPVPSNLIQSRNTQAPP